MTAQLLPNKFLHVSIIVFVAALTAVIILTRNRSERRPESHLSRPPVNPLAGTEFEAPLNRAIAEALKQEEEDRSAAFWRSVEEDKRKAAVPYGKRTKEFTCNVSLAPGEKPAPGVRVFVDDDGKAWKCVETTPNRKMRP